MSGLHWPACSEYLKVKCIRNMMIDDVCVSVYAYVGKHAVREGSAGLYDAYEASRTRNGSVREEKAS